MLASRWLEGEAAPTDPKTNSWPIPSAVEEYSTFIFEATIDAVVPDMPWVCSFSVRKHFGSSVDEPTTVERVLKRPTSGF
jgi:hypothetical protein